MILRDNLKTFNCIDLFAGAGGLSYGFERAGVKTVYALELNKTYAKTFSMNFPDAEMRIGDIREVTDREIDDIGKKYKTDFIIGGPPCQGFSIAGNIARNFLEDPRNGLFREFIRFVKIIKPKMFVLENVATMLTHNKGKTMAEIRETFNSIGYAVYYKVLNAVDYNVPQERRRVFIVGVVEGTAFEFPHENSKHISVKEAIGDLPVLQSGEKSDIPLHEAMNHSRQMLEKMSYIKDGGNRLDIPEKLRPKSGDARKYIRYNSNRPSFCVTGDMRKIFHYSQNRALTCRELARLQTFPDTYKFYGNSIEVQQQIGNAVPCNLAYAVACACLRILTDEKISED